MKQILTRSSLSHLRSSASNINLIVYIWFTMMAMRAILVSLGMFVCALSGSGQQPRQARADSLLAAAKRQNAAESACTYAKLAISLMEDEPLEGQKHAEQSLQSAEEAGDSLAIGCAMHALGEIAYIQGDFKRSLACHRRAILSRSRTGDRAELARSHGSLGRLFDAMGNADSSLHHLRTALAINEELGLKDQISESLNSLGVTHFRAGNYDKAVEYLRKSVEIDQSLGNREGMAYGLTNIGSIYSLQGKLDQAAENHQRALDIRRELGNELQVARSLNNLGIIYADKEQYDAAIRYLQESIAIKQRLGYATETHLSMLNLGSIYVSRGDPRQAVRFLTQAHTYLDSAGMARPASQALYWLTRAYKDNGEYERALSAHEEFYAIKDSMWQNEKEQKLAELLVQFESERKELENQLLLKENDKSRTEKFYLLITLVIASVFLVLALWFLITSARTNRKLRLSKEQIRRINATLEEKIIERTNHLEIAMRELDTVLYQAAHHLRSPLTSIVGLQTLVGMEDDPEAQMVMNQKILQVMNDMDRMLMKLILINEVMRRKPEIQAIDFSSVVDAAQEKYVPAAYSEEVRFETAIVPAAKLISDPTLLEYAMGMLLENAFFYARFSRNDAPRVSLNIETAPDAEAVVLKVSNNGPPIPKDQVTKIFDMFYRASIESNGTGLGLYIFQKCMEKLGGAVTVEQGGEQEVEFQVILMGLG